MGSSTHGPNASQRSQAGAASRRHSIRCGMSRVHRNRVPTGVQIGFSRRLSRGSATPTPLCTARPLRRSDLEADSNRVHMVRARHDGRDLELHATVVVLAAGAFHSPQILLRSCNSAWPNGLANSSDQVGRNLMFHTADIIALWAPHRLDRRARQKKAISVRDFYNREGERLGYVQSMGLEAGRGVIAAISKIDCVVAALSTNCCYPSSSKFRRTSQR